MTDLNLTKARVGVFDSGVGGLSVLRALLQALPDEQFDFVADERFLPYGDKPQAEIRQRVLDLSAWLHGQACKALVIACNTATAAGAESARAEHPDWPIVGIEPAVKPASLMTRTGVVGILATTNTVASARFQALVQRFDPLARVVAVPCPGLVELIETTPIPVPAIEALLAPVMSELREKNADVIVLGCTHYPFVASLIQALAGPQVAVIETGMAVARQLLSRLQAEGLFNQPGVTLPDTERVRFFTSGDPVHFKTKLIGLLGPAWEVAEVGRLPL